jgi:hypothetical protein
MSQITIIKLIATAETTADIDKYDIAAISNILANKLNSVVLNIEAIKKKESDFIHYCFTGKFPE